jgi:hypothetical protein
VVNGTNILLTSNGVDYAVSPGVEVILGNLNLYRGVWHLFGRTSYRINSGTNEFNIGIIQNASTIQGTLGTASQPLTLQTSAVIQYPQVYTISDVLGLDSSTNYKFALVSSSPGFIKGTGVTMTSLFIHLKAVRIA